MKRGMLTWGLLLCGCGTFEPVTMAGEAEISGCLRRGDGAPAVDVPVFVVHDHSRVAETRSDAQGCFLVAHAPSGRQVLVAHDFRGNGLVEPVRLYASQRLQLTPRVLATLALNPVLPGLRGVGAGELLDTGEDPTRLSCKDGTLRIAGGNHLSAFDSVTGERTERPGAVTYVSSPDPYGRRYDAQWPSGQPVQPLGEGEAWFRLELNERAFVGLSGLFALPSTRDWQYGANGHLSSLGVDGPCSLLDDGRCVRLLHRDGGYDFETWSPDAAPVNERVDLPVGEVPLLAAVSADGRTATWVTNGASDASLWTRSALHVLARVKRFENVHAVLNSGETGAVVSGPRATFTFRLEGAGLQTMWARVHTATGQVELVPFPQLDLHPVQPELGAALPMEDRLIWTAQPTASTWQVSVAEHRGGTLRLRTTVLPDAQAPNYLNARGLEYFPGFTLVAAPEAGLEVLLTNNRVLVLEAGAPFASARPLAMLGLFATPVCAAGNSLLAWSQGPDFAHQAYRYDIRRIADELGRAP